MEENRKRKLEDILSAAERIIKSREEEVKEDLFGSTVDNKTLNEIKEIFESIEKESHDSQLAYDLYYGVIKRLVLKIIPKGDVRDLIQLLICNMLTGVELLRKGQVRGQDSRQQATAKLNEVADIIMEWSYQPYDYLGLAQVILDKCKEKGISTEERTILDFVPNKRLL